MITDIHSSSDLNKYPGIFILAALKKDKYTGVLTILAGKTKRRLIFNVGNINECASTISGETAVGLAVKKRILEQDTFTSIVRKSQAQHVSPELLALHNKLLSQEQYIKLATLAARKIVQAICIQSIGHITLSPLTETSKQALPSISVDPYADISLALFNNASSDLVGKWIQTCDTIISLDHERFFKVAAFLKQLKIETPETLPADIQTIKAWRKLPTWNDHAILAMILLNVVDVTQVKSSVTITKKVDYSKLPQQQREILQFRDMISEQDYFTRLELSTEATNEQVEDAYFTQAQKWHSDRFAGIELGTAQAALEEIFTHISEAYEVLKDPKKREGYLYLLDRERQGLPTDVEVILEAEDLFRRAQIMFDQGKYQTALPLLEKAVALNKGEAEFWIYLGMSKFSSHGEASYREAIANIEQGMEMQNSVKTKGYLFMSQIERMRENYKQAEKFINEILSRSPNHKEAIREKRFILMKKQKAQQKAQHKNNGILGKFFGK